MNVWSDACPLAIGRCPSQRPARLGSACGPTPRSPPEKWINRSWIAASGWCGVVGSTDAPSYCVKEVNSKLYRTSVGSVSK